MTIHSAKGLEFDSVFLPGWEEGIFPSPRSVDERNGLEEERRLAYVAITRARNKLTITYSKTRYEYGEVKTMQPSRFIKELPETNLEISQNILDAESEERYKNSYDEYNDEYNDMGEEYVNKKNYRSSERVGRYNNFYSPKGYNNNKNHDFEGGERVVYRDNYPKQPLESSNMQNIAKRVIHPTFGEGVVIKADGKKLTIAFKSCGVKTIIEDFIKFI